MQGAARRIRASVAAMSRPVSRILVVDDHESLRGQLMRALVRRADDVIGAGTVAEARDALAAPPPPDLVLLDVALPDGDAFDVLAAIDGLTPAPVVVGMSGSATNSQAFALATRGVRAFIGKPLELDELYAVIDAALDAAPPFAPTVRAAVGHTSLDDVEEDVRALMVKEALALSGGNRRAAARMLSITRQRLQYILRSAD